MAEDPGVRRKTLAKRVKNNISMDDATSRREQAESLPQQGQMLRDSSPVADLIWASAISTLSSEVMKFALNAATDTLPHNSNLAKWGGGLHSGACKLCGNKQTLIHVLNSGEIALQLRRYNRGHDRVLTAIVSVVQSHLPESYKCTADLSDTYNFPSHITPTNLRPPVVRRKEVTLYWRTYHLL